MADLSKTIKGGLSVVRNLIRSADEELEAQRLAREAANPPIKASEAYGLHEGSYLKPIFYDRMKVDLSKGKFGGPGFSGIQLVDPNYANAKAVAGVTDQKMATRILNRNKAQVPKDAKVIWTPSVGGLEQHKSNSTMFGEFADIFANQRKNMSAEQIQKLSDRASTMTDNKGRLIFPNGIDLGARNFRQQVKTYDQRALMADILAGRGVGGEKGRTVPVEELLEKNLDPNMAGAGTLDLGNRLFRLEGNIIDRPDLHSDYRKILTGEDLDVNYLPVPIRDVYSDWEAQKALELAAQGKNRAVTLMDYTKNDPTVQLTEELLTKMQKAGHKDGGVIDDDSKLMDYFDKRIAGMAKGGEVGGEDAELLAYFDKRMGMAQGGGAFKKLEFMADGGIPHMADAGKVVKGARGFLKKLFGSADEAVPAALPLAERDANLAKFLEPSKDKRKLYHGSSADISQFKTHRTLENENKPFDPTNFFQEKNGRDAIFLTPDSNFANDWVHGKENASVYPVHAQVKNPFDYDNPEHLEAAKQVYSQLYPLRKDPTSNLMNEIFRRAINDLSDKNMRGNWATIEDPRFQKVLNKLGHDSFYVNENNVKNLGLYDPKKIKSAIGNRGTYDTSVRDVTKAKGGLLHMADAGRVVKGASKVLKKLFGFADEVAPVASAAPTFSKVDILPAAEREANLAKMLSESKVKNVLYHGTAKDVKEFDKSKLKRIGYGDGFHLAESPYMSSYYARQKGEGAGEGEGANVMPVHAVIKNPFIELEGGPYYWQIPGKTDKQKTDWLKSQGYDGIKYDHGISIENESPYAWVAFEPEQIKSAIGNRGTYNVNDKDITKAEGGPAFKKLQFMDKGGITTTGGSFSPEELGVSADEIGLSRDQLETVKKNAPAVFKKAGKMAKDQLTEEYNQLKTAGGMKDFALRTGASYLGGIPDLINLGLMIPDAVVGTNLSSDKPWFGSAQYLEMMKDAGMLGENEFPLAEVVAGLLSPASLIKKGRQIYKNSKASTSAPKKRRGGLTALAR